MRGETKSTTSDETIKCRRQGNLGSRTDIEIVGHKQLKTDEMRCVQGLYMCGANHRISSLRKNSSERGKWTSMLISHFLHYTTIPNTHKMCSRIKCRATHFFCIRMKEYLRRYICRSPKKDARNKTNQAEVAAPDDVMMYWQGILNTDKFVTYLQ